MTTEKENELIVKILRIMDEQLEIRIDSTNTPTIHGRGVVAAIILENILKPEIELVSK